tara:strand:+ start:129171 stop:130175 length:1005 start_codon:yes stop_codon:yes gene_type:complete
MPDGSEEISGGNLYNAKLCEALESCTEVRRMRIGAFARHPLAPGTYLVDTLNLDSAVDVIARRQPGQRFVLLVHHLPSFEPGLLESDPALAIERKVLGEFDGYIATGEFTRAWLASQGFGERTMLLEPPIAVAKTAPRTFVAPVRAVMVCNLISRKGVLEFLDGLAVALEEDTETFLEFFLEIVGRDDLDASYAAACANRVAADVGLRRHVRLLGALSPAEVACHYQRANLFLSASRMETFGIALQEARHHGLPILAVRGGNAEHHVVAGRTGIVCESPEALADALVSLLGDSARQASLLGAAQELRPVETETWGAAAERLRTVLAEWSRTRWS